MNKFKGKLFLNIKAIRDKVIKLTKIRRDVKREYYLCELLTYGETFLSK
jgi:hypothetical protein